MAQIQSNQGQANIKGNLRLYTIASYTTSYNGSIAAVSCVNWSDTWQFSAADRAAEYPDYISVTAPSITGFKASAFEAYATGMLTYFDDGSQYAWKADQGYTSVVYAFNEFVNNGFKVDEAYARMWVTNNTTSTNNTFISQYVHTYGNTAPSIGIGPGGVTFILNNTKASWQIASSVNW